MSVDAMDRRTSLLRLAVGAGIAVACGDPGTLVHAGGRGDESDAELVTSWLETVSGLVQRSPGYSPPVASRVFAYVGVTMYEALAPASRDHRSLAGQLEGLRHVPAGHGYGRSVAWPLVANHAVAGMVRHLFPDAPPAERQRHRSSRGLVHSPHRTVVLGAVAAPFRRARRARDRRHRGVGSPRRRARCTPPQRPA